MGVSQLRPVLLRQRAFLEPFLSRPGGLANYAGVFLAQLNYLNYLGALVFVLTEGMVLLTAIFCLARIGGRAPGLVALVPLFVLLLLRNRYGCPVPAMSVGLLLALAASAAHVWLPLAAPLVGDNNQRIDFQSPVLFGRALVRLAFRGLVLLVCGDPHG